MADLKVMCLKQLKGKCGISGEPMSGPEVGDKDTVIDVVNKPGIKGTYYALERFGMGYLYNSKYFATLPEQSADQMQEENHESLIYQR